MSGALLREVGTTNKTHLKDYEQAITLETAMLLKVHPSNFRITGFTSEVALPELVALGRRYGLLVVEDLGSGCLIDLSRYGLEKEPTVQETLKAGADLVLFSGDKLLGGPQAGLALGSREVITRLRAHPLTRALRPDKLTLAGLEATLRLYLDEPQAVAEIPTLRMLSRPVAELDRQARGSGPEPEACLRIPGPGAGGGQYRARGRRRPAPGEPAQPGPGPGRTPLDARSNWRPACARPSPPSSPGSSKTPCSWICAPCCRMICPPSRRPCRGCWRPFNHSGSQVQLGNQNGNCFRIFLA